MKCDQCGAENADVRRYCHSCGAVLVPELPTPVWQRVGMGIVVLLISVPVGVCGVAVTGAAISDAIQGDEYSILPGFLVFSIPSLLIGALGVYIAARLMRTP